MIAVPRRYDQLRPGQLRAKDHIVWKRRCALFLDMGFGKTIATLLAFLELQFLGDTKRWLIVAPLKVARDTWHDELAEWSFTSGLTLAKALGSRKQRIAALKSGSDLITINIENVRWLENELAKKEYRGENFPFDGIVLDESSKFKTKGTKRWYSARRLSKRVEFFIELTGTPAPESLLNLHPQIELIDGGERLGVSYEDFKRKYFFATDYEQKKWEMRKGADKKIMAKIADICMVPNEEDYVEVPPMITKIEKVKLSKTDRARYDKFEKDYLLHVDETVVEAVNAAALNTKLLQMANGCVYETLEDGTRIPHHIHDAKIEKLKEIVDEAEDMPLLVAYTFKTDVVRIKQAFPNAVVYNNDEGIKDRWNRREIPMLLISPKSGAHGLNIQLGGNLLVWFGITYSNEQFVQLVKRLVRSGQIELWVMVYIIMVEDTVDEIAYASCQRKINREKAFLNDLREYIRRKKAHR